MAKPKYRGKLAEPLHPGLIELANCGGFSEWVKSSPRIRKELVSRMSLLLEHYQVDPESPTCWYELALALAQDHVRGFQVTERYRRPGRKRATSHIPDARLRVPRKGRPRKHFDDDHDELVRIVDGRKKQLVSDKPIKSGKVTDKDVLRDLIGDYAKSQKKSVTRTITVELSYWQKRLSESRRCVRSKIPKKEEK